MSDLVERLRRTIPTVNGGLVVDGLVNPEGPEAADRIAELEAALESIADHNKLRDWTSTSDNPETHWVTRDGFYAVIARAALNPSARSE